MFALYKQSTEFLFVVKRMHVFCNHCVCVFLRASEEERGGMEGMSLELSALLCVLFHAVLFLCFMTTLP